MENNPFNYLNEKTQPFIVLSYNYYWVPRENDYFISALAVGEVILLAMYFLKIIFFPSLKEWGILQLTSQSYIELWIYKFKHICNFKSTLHFKV